MNIYIASDPVQMYNITQFGVNYCVGIIIKHFNVRWQTNEHLKYYFAEYYDETR